VYSYMTNSYAKTLRRQCSSNGAVPRWTTDRYDEIYGVILLQRTWPTRWRRQLS